jgi:class 3 adenylate cyclase
VDIDENLSFCPECGATLQGRIVAADNVPLQPSASKDDFEATLNYVSILFADVKDITSTMVEWDPEEAHNILAPIIETMLAAVNQFNGTIIKTNNNGIVAIFGAPQFFEDHALRACLAAHLIQSQLESRDDGLKIFVGLNSGEVSMTVIGNREGHIEYDITGAAVHLAARMVQTAKPGSVQMTNDILFHVEKMVHVNPIGKIEVKGFSAPVEAFELISIKNENNLLSTRYMFVSAASTNSEATLRHVSILFADIKGSTSVISKLDPEEARKILAPVVEEMLSAVYQYNGTIIHTAGDGIIAAFGAPQSYEDHALRACLAACLMQSQIKSLEGELKIRVGLNTGEVFMNIVGTKSQHIEYDIAGAAVNLAATMEKTAKPGTVQMTKNTFTQVKEVVNAECLSETEETYELKGIKDEHNLIAIKYRPSFIPFVGRDDIMRQLNNLLQQAKSGKGSMVALEAEAGQGKSRIISELLKDTGASQLQVVFAGGFSHTTNVTLFPVTQIFQKLMDVNPDDSIDEIKKIIRPFIAKIKKPFAENAMLSLLNITQHSPEWDQLDAQIKNKAVFSIGRKILKEISAKKPLVLILEDLHWVDKTSEKFIDRLLRKISERSIFILATYRPGYHDERLNLPDYSLIKVGPIQEDQLNRVLDIILGTHDSIQNLKKDILHACAGNPFFMQEMISSLISDNILLGNTGNYHLNPENVAKKVKLAESIFALLQTKIDKLPIQQKELLQAAAVVGERFQYDLIEEISETESKITRDNLNKLTNAHYIYEAQLYPELEFSFNHALIQEALYSTLLKSVRNKIHCKILTILEQLPEDKKDEKIGILAGHAFSGQNWEKAFRYCARASENALVLNSIESAIQFGKQAVEAAAHLEDQSNIIEELTRVHFDIGHAYIHLGSPAEQAIESEKALELALKSKNRALEAQARSFNAVTKLGSCPATEALLYAESGYELAKHANSEHSLHFAECILLQCYIFVGQYKNADRIGKILFSAIPGFNYFIKELRIDVGTLSIFYLTVAQVAMGDFSAVEDKMKLYLSSIDMEQSTMGSAMVLSGIAYALLMKGESFEKTEYYLHTAIRHATDANMIILNITSYAALAHIYFRTGRREEGMVLLDRALAIGESLHFAFIATFSMGLLAEDLLLSHQLERATQFIQTTMEICKNRRLPGMIAWLSRVSAEIDMQLPDPDYHAIKLKLEDALQQSTALHMTLHEAHCHAAFAKLYQQMNDNSKAKQELIAAQFIYDNIGYHSNESVA